MSKFEKVTSFWDPTEKQKIIVDFWSEEHRGRLEIPSTSIEQCVEDLAKIYPNAGKTRLVNEEKKRSAFYFIRDGFVRHIRDHNFDVQVSWTLDGKAATTIFPAANYFRALDKFTAVFPNAGSVLFKELQTGDWALYLIKNGASVRLAPSGGNDNGA